MANKRYDEFPTGTYDITKIFLQADATTGELEKINLPVIPNANPDDQLFILPVTTGSPIAGLFALDPTDTLSAFQVLDDAGATYTFYTCNKFYDAVSGWQDGGKSRAGAVIQMTNDEITFYKVSTGTTFGRLLSILNNGFVGIGDPAAVPTKTLDVRSTAAIQLRLGYPGNADTYTYDLGRNSTSGYFHILGNEPSPGFIFSALPVMLSATDSDTNDASALLQVNSTTKGVRFPNMTTTQKNAIGSPAQGLQVFDTTLNQMSYYNGSSWINF